MTGAGVSDTAAMRTRLLELTSKFVTRTIEDLAQMRDALARLDAGNGTVDPNALELIQQLAHRACGTGGTLGLDALSDAAGALERTIEACPANALPDAAARAEIAARIDAMAAKLPPL
jgi:HPt (histidine-containing phosphotransfer) domain-containing protein